MVDILSQVPVGDVRKVIQQPKFQPELLQIPTLSQPPPEGVILKPSEMGYVSKITERGVPVSIPELKEYYPARKTIKGKIRKAIEKIPIREMTQFISPPEGVYYIKRTPRGGYELREPLPFGMTPFGKGVAWVRYDERTGRYVPTEPPPTVVGMVSKAFWEVERKVEEKLGEPPFLRLKFPLTPEIYDIPGQLALWAFFTPAFKTGTESIQKAITKTKFEGLGKKLSYEEKMMLKEKIKRTIKSAKKEDLAKWVKNALKKIKDDPSLSQQEKMMKAEWLRALIIEAKTGRPIITESGKIDYFAYQNAVKSLSRKVPEKTTEEIIYVIEKVPEMKFTGVISGITSALGKLIKEKKEKVKEREKVGIGVVSASPFFKEEKGRERVAPKGVPKIAPRVKTLEKQIPKIAPKEKPRVTPREIPRIIPKLKISSRVVPKERQRIAFGVPKPYFRPEPEKQKKKKRKKQRSRLIIPIPILLKKEKEKKIKGKKRRRKEIFIPEIRRYKKWYPLGKYPELEKAKEKAKGVVLTTLGASLRIRRKVGRKEEFVKLKPSSRIFRPSKVEPFVIVQKREARLMAIPERREIVSARRGRIRW